MEMRGPKLVLGDHQNSSLRSSDMMVSDPKLTRVLLRISIKARASHVENREVIVRLAVAFACRLALGWKPMGDVGFLLLPEHFYRSPDKMHGLETNWCRRLLLLSQRFQNNLCP